MGVKCRCQRTKRSTESPQMKQGISLVPNSAAMLPVVRIRSSKQALRVPGLDLGTGWRPAIEPGMAQDSE